MRQIILFFTLWVILSPNNLHSQAFVDADNYGGSGDNYTRAYNLTADSLGNTILCGRFSDTARLGSFQFVSEGFSDAFVAKRNSQGIIVWAVTIAGKDFDNIYGVTTDISGNIYVNGLVYDTAYVQGNAILSNFPGLPGGRRIGYVIKLDASGNLIWLKTYEAFAAAQNGSRFVLADDIALGPHGDLYIQGNINGSAQFGNITASSGNRGGSFLAKLSSSTGTFEWVNPSIDEGGPVDIVAGNDGYIYSLYVFRSRIQVGGQTVNAHIPGTTSGENLLVKWDTLGNYVWNKHIYTDYLPVNRSSDLRINHISPCGPAGIALAGGFLGTVYVEGQALGPDIGRKPNAFVIRFDGQGSMEWFHQLIGSNYSYGVAANPKGEVFISGHPSFVSDSIDFGGGLVLQNTRNEKHYFAKYDSNGQGVWANSLFANTSSGSYMKYDFLSLGTGNSLYAFGETNWDTVFVDTDTLLRKGPGWVMFTEIADTTRIGPPPLNKIQGKVFEENNLNCQQDVGESPLSQMLVQAMPGPYLGITDSLGNYEIAVPPGAYTLSQVFPYSPGLSYDTVCPPGGTHSVNFANFGQSASGFDFADTLSSCAYLEVQVVSNRKRICSNSTSRVYYENKGSDTAYNAFLSLEFDPYLVPVGASKPWQVIDSIHWEITLGDIPPNSSGSVLLDEFVPCNILYMGLTSCIRAEIFPANRNICNPPAPDWSRAELSLESSCLLRDTVQFTLSNSGEGNMNDSVGWQLFLDAVLVDSGQLKLDSGQLQMMVVPTNGQTAYLRVEQVTFHPEMTWVAAFEEACGLGEDSIFVSKGFVDQFHLLDWRKRTERIQCSEIVGSYDPNDKQASPIGLTSAHIIPPESRISYRIRFQNTGTDTAFKVVLRDTLPSALDPTSIQLEGASHPYSLSIEGSNPSILVFTFDPIILPDSNVNLEASNGFVNFGINVKSGIPLGTSLENSAAIYFDFNPPVITNAVTHTVDTLKDVNIQPDILSSYGPIDKAVAMEDAQVCLEDSLTIMATSPSLGEGIWTLLDGAGYIDEPLNSESSIIGVEAGPYTLIWTVSDGPLSSVDTLHLEVLEVPDQVDIIPSSNSIFADSDANFFKWYINGVLIPESDQTIYPDSSGSYSVSVSYDGICFSALSIPIEWNVVGIDDFEKNRLGVYPNPTNGTLHVSLPEVHQNSRLYIYKESGQLVWTSSPLPYSATGDIRIDLKDLPNGLYYIRLQPQNRGALFHLSRP